jgi:hypothetical protein
MLLVAVAVALPYPQDAASPADPTAAVPGADGLTADLRHHHGHNSGGYGDTWLAVNIKSLIICRLCFTDWDIGGSYGGLGWREGQNPAETRGCRHSSRSCRTSDFPVE